MVAGPGRRIVGIDAGLKRIGIAWSDPTRSIATALGTFNHDLAVAFLDSRITEFSDLLIGWPVDLNNQEGEATERTKAFENRLKNRYKDKTFHRFDERFTSTMALQAIRSAGLSKAARSDKALVDAVAATILLQNFLDYLKR